MIKKESVYFKIQEVVEQRKKQEQAVVPRNRKKEERLQFLKQFSVPNEKKSSFNTIECIALLIGSNSEFL